MKGAQKIVEIRFYNQDLERTHNPADAFERKEESFLTRFVAAYCFSIRENVLKVTLSRVVFHFFHPGSLLSHLDNIVNVFQKRKGSENLTRLREVSEQERQAIVEILLATVIGGGVAGIENGKVGISWYSGSIKDELGCTNPKIPSSEVLKERLRKRLESILASQT